MDVIKTIIAVMLITTAAAAQVDIQYGIYDINTKEGIEAAHILIGLDEDTPLVEGDTNENGVVTLETIPELPGLYSFITCTGYLPDTLDLDTSGGEDQYITDYLIPISEDGIVRLQGNDMTYNTEPRQIRVYYKENDRLAGTYGINDTIQLIINKEYIFRPEYKQMDVFTGKDMITTITPYMFGIFAPLTVVLMLILIIVYAISKAWGKK